MEQVTTPAARAQVVAAARSRLAENRNLCEDFLGITGVEQEAFRVCGELDLFPDANAAVVKAEVLWQVERYLAPPVWNYTLSEMLGRVRPDGSRYTAPDVFDGPVLDSGFYDDAELEASELRTEIRLSDLIGIITKIPGVRAVRELLITPAALATPLVAKWVLPVTPGMQPVLDVDHSRLVFYKQQLPIVPVETLVQQAYASRIEAERRRLEAVHEDDLDLALPVGRFRGPEQYSSIQEHFPALYGLGANRLSLEGLDDAARKLRQAQVRQLQGYLLFVDQLFANFCAQLSHVRELFSADPRILRTYFAQRVNLADADLLYRDPAPAWRAANPHPSEPELEAAWQAAYAPLLESDLDAATRRNQFLDHLIARFAERFHEYAAIMHSLFGADQASLIPAKCQFLEDYPTLSGTRALARNAANADPAALWDSNNVSGFERRVASLLDIRDARRRSLSQLQGDDFAEVVEEGAGQFRARVLNRGAETEVLLQSRTTFSTRALAQAGLLEILAAAQLRPRYQLKQAADGRPFFNLLDPNDGVLATRYFATESERETTIRGLVQFMTHWYSTEGMFVIENLLLRPGPRGGPFLPVCLDPNCSDCPGDDPYSYRLHIVLPAYAGRFATMDFRRFVENVLREELPAHLLAKICWISRADMERVEAAYRGWLKVAVEGTSSARKKTLAALLDALAESKNVYPTGQLRTCEQGEDAARFQLGRTALGTIKRD
jgi:hypothetical protein